VGTKAEEVGRLGDNSHKYMSGRECFLVNKNAMFMMHAHELGYVTERSMLKIQDESSIEVRMDTALFSQFSIFLRNCLRQCLSYAL
jgi:hypothetical protein